MVARYGRLDILVNNAGIALRKPTLELSLADWEKVVDVNLNAVFLCSRAAGRTMVAAGRGAIVNVASMMGLSGGGLYPNLSYHSSKGGVVNLTRALAVEWAGQGVRVNAVAPTWVKTELTQGLFKDPALIARVMAVTPLQRVAEPEDVAHAIVFLASDKAVDDHRPHAAGGRRLPGAVAQRLADEARAGARSPARTGPLSSARAGRARCRRAAG